MMYHLILVSLDLEGVGAWLRRKKREGKQKRDQYDYGMKVPSKLLSLLCLQKHFLQHLCKMWM